MPAACLMAWMFNYQTGTGGQTGKLSGDCESVNREMIFTIYSKTKIHYIFILEVKCNFNDLCIHRYVFRGAQYTVCDA